MASSLGEAYIHIIPTTEGMSDNITKALGGESEKAGQTAGKSMLGGIASVVGGGAAVLAGATTAIAGTMIAGAKGVAEYGDNIDKMSQKIGISASEYQKWDYVMARAGTSVDVMKNGMKTLSAQAQNNSEAFQKLGISQEEAANMSNSELFHRAVETLSGMEEGAERTTLATQLLGKAGLEMGPLFNEGTDAIAEQMQMAEEYGMIMSDEMVAASATFQDSMETLGRTMAGVKNDALAELLPSMSQIADGMSQIFAGDTSSGVEKMSQGIQQLAGKIAEAVPRFLQVGGELILSLGTAIMNNMPSLLSNMAQLLMQLVSKIAESLPEMQAKGAELLMQLATGLLNNGPTLLGNATTVLGNMITTVMGYLPQMLQQGVDLILNLANGVISNAPQLVSAAAENMAQLLARIAESLPEMLQKGIEIIAQLAAGLIQAIPQAVAAVPQIIAGIRDAFSQFDWGSIGLNIIKGIAAGLANAAGMLFDAAVNAAKSAYKGATSALGINSPSTLMRDEVGYNISAGIAAGILQGSGTITDAMGVVEGQVTDSAQSWLASGSMAASGRANSYSYGGFEINVYQSPGQSSEELVDMIEDRINERVNSGRAVFA